MTPVADLTGGQPLLTHQAQEGFVNLVVVEYPDPPLVHSAQPDLLNQVSFQKFVKQDTPHTAGAFQLLAPIEDALVTRRNRLLVVIPADILKDLFG
jgi:hypothetical protein